MVHFSTENPSYHMLAHRKIVANYYRKYQKYERALEILMEVYKAERKIYNRVKKGDAERIESGVEDEKESKNGIKMKESESENSKHSEEKGVFHCKIKEVDI